MRKILAAALLVGASTAALAQSANPGSPSGASSVTLNTGTNTVGSIANTAFGISGPIPAGTNSIGNIGSITSPLPAGTNSIGNIGSITSALPAGTNAIGSVSPTAIGVTTTNGSTTVTTGGTFQTALASSATRKGCLVQNPFSATETLFVYFGTGTASTANSVGLAPGGVTSCAVSGSYVVTDAIQVTAATTGHAFVLNSQ